jgi:hypothetical protein
VTRICRQSAREDGKIISPKQWTPLPPEDQKINLILDYVSAAGRIKSIRNPSDPIWKFKYGDREYILT